MIKLEIQFESWGSGSTTNAPRGQIDCLDFGLNELDVAENLANRVDDVARRKIACRDLVQHRREQDEIPATDQGNFHIRAASERFLEILCRGQPGESAT